MKACQLGLLFTAMTAMTANAADMKGDWVGLTHTIIAGAGGPHWPDSKGTWQKPLTADREVTFRVTGQDGRRFWGETIIAGDSSSGGKPTTEPFIGTVGLDDVTVMMSDTDGYFAGKLTGNTLSYCYLQAGAKQPGDKPAVVTCNEVKKK
ncbi:hypothetical protein [Pseudorhodoplanes sp.]|jgi:hypothetical protein|uniref:hypothetical protein n=1 Tax=Pseudorhodoplanes sp. TaxID=1934341 RepID=UPI002CDDEB8C|nr:hypothetical protein [Pseudorhodoplanes sp.]HWV43828.1 hypothetical protein [Pseudorhodoplanes sp.]